MNELTTWTYEGYWNVVLGDHRSPRDVVVYAEIDRRPASHVAEWLREAQSVAWSQANRGESEPAEWESFYDLAREELEKAGENASI